MAGRESKLTPGLQETIRKALVSGLYLREAAAHAGIHEATLHRWMARGRQEDSGPYREFREAIKRASAENELDRLGRIRDAGKAGRQQHT